MFTNQNAQTSPAWLQIIVLLGLVVVLMVMLLPRRPLPINPQNIHQLREALRLERAPIDTKHFRQMQINTINGDILATTGYSNYLWHRGNGSPQVVDLESAGGYTPQIFFAGEKPIAIFTTWQGSMFLLDMNSGQMSQIFGSDFNATIGQNWGISPDGSVIAGATPETLYVMETATQQQRFRISAEPGYGFWYSQPTFNVDGTVLVTAYRDMACSCDSDIALWDTTTGQQNALLGKFRDGYVGTFRFSNDMRLLAVGGSSRAVAGSDGVLQIWNLETGTELAYGNIGGVAIQQLLFSPDQRFLAAQGYDSVWLWEIEAFRATGEALVAEDGSGSAGNFNGIAFSPDSRLFVFGTPDGGIQAVDTATGVWLTEIPAHKIQDIHFSADGRSLITSGRSDGTIRFWELQDRRVQSVTSGAIVLPTPVMTPTVRAST